MAGLPMAGLLKGTWNDIFHTLFLLFSIYNMYINIFSSLQIWYQPEKEIYFNFE